MDSEIRVAKNQAPVIGHHGLMSLLAPRSTAVARIRYSRAILRSPAEINPFLLCSFGHVRVRAITVTHCFVKLPTSADHSDLEVTEEERRRCDRQGELKR